MISDENLESCNSIPSNFAAPAFDLASITAAYGRLNGKSSKSTEENEEREASAGGPRHRIDLNSPEFLTLDDQLARGSALFDRFRWETGIPPGNEDYCSLGFSEWLLSERPRRAQSTWRHSREAACRFLERVPDVSAPRASALINRTGQPILRGLDETTLSLMPADRFEEVRKAVRIHSSGDEGSTTLADWMLAGIATALGPNEWMLTEVVDTVDAQGIAACRLPVARHPDGTAPDRRHRPRDPDIPLVGHRPGWHLDLSHDRTGDRQAHSSASHEHRDRRKIRQVLADKRSLDPLPSRIRNIPACRVLDEGGRQDARAGGAGPSDPQRESLMSGAQSKR
jgi:hypothetical protein